MSNTLRRVFLTLDVPEDQLPLLLGFSNDTQRYMTAHVDAANDHIDPTSLKLMPVYEALAATHKTLRQRSEEAERHASQFEREAYEAAEHNHDYLGAMQATTEAKTAMATAQAFGAAAVNVEKLAQHLGYSGRFDEDPPRGL